MSTTVLDEVEDRHRRRRNLIFSGISELTSGSVEERREADRAMVERILKDLLLDDKEPEQVYRVGKPVPGKSRLLKVRFDDEETGQNILRNARKLRDISRQNGVYINPDLTVAQRRERKQLVEELKRRRDAGDEVMISKGRIVEKVQNQNFH